VPGLRTGIRRVPRLSQTKRFNWVALAEHTDLTLNQRHDPPALLTDAQLAISGLMRIRHAL
jgi:hypothetical protein